MATWDNTKPYGNDAAADWFGGVMQRTGLRKEWREAIVSDSVEKRRAAVWLFLQLGVVYVWPIDDYAPDVELTLATLADLPDAMAVNSNDKQTLEHRLQHGSDKPGVPHKDE